MQRPSRKILTAALVICVVFLLGVYAGGHYYRLGPATHLLPDSVRNAFFPGDNLMQLQREVENILEDSFYLPVDRATLENGALEGMIASLDDPYTDYFTPEEFRLFQLHSDGAFVGIGVVLETKETLLTVVSTLEGSPAAAAGVEAGDVIIAVDGQSIEGMSGEEVTPKIQGEEDTPVLITVRRGEGEVEFEIIRKKIEFPVVREEVLEAGGRKIGYIRLDQFSEDSGAKVAGALDKLTEAGAEGVILDLRNNGGGLLDEAVEVSSIFIENGVIVSTVGRTGKIKEYEARGAADEAIPLVVLVNGNSASASEITAGAIKDDNRGVLVGEKTFGKGVVQVIQQLSNQGAIKFTSAVYYTPGGIDINEVGIEPDIIVADDPATEADEQLDRALAYLSG
ncbi:MAG: S41 family peptidase [Thermoleophilia bacterium]